jgi:hypothetical protein
LKTAFNNLTNRDKMKPTKEEIIRDIQFFEGKYQNAMSNPMLVNIFLDAGTTDKYRDAIQAHHLVQEVGKIESRIENLKYELKKYDE